MSTIAINSPHAIQTNPPLPATISTNLDIMHFRSDFRSRSRSQSDSTIERTSNGVILDHEAALWQCSPLRFKTHYSAHHAQIWF
ncbi:hypothetical protein glysoja_038560 [Glycine soja]|uniref:Uncharacterized protein n=1 Tax=Glycine soja TaxID=3848 RepID=A0A0B2SKI6_GLYSO|nr:hypothetical protein glysoja_038560 [Glycine soja]